MNEERERVGQTTQQPVGQAALQQAGGLAAATVPSGAVEQAVQRLRKSNGRFSELVHCQRDQHCRLTGNNPIQIDPPQEKPRAEGSLHDLIVEMETFENNLEQLNQLTDAWGTL